MGLYQPMGNRAARSGGHFPRAARIRYTAALRGELT